MIEQKKNTALMVAGWVAYVIASFFAITFAMVFGFWPAFVMALACIFGPKVWSILRTPQI